MNTGLHYSRVGTGMVLEKDDILIEPMINACDIPSEYP